MNRSYRQKTRNNESKLSIQKSQKAGKGDKNDTSMLNVSNLSVSHMSREGIQRVREKVYGMRGVQMSKEVKEVASARIAPEDQRKSILARKPVNLQQRTFTEDDKTFMKSFYSSPKNDPNKKDPFCSFCGYSGSMASPRDKATNASS